MKSLTILSFARPYWLGPLVLLLAGTTGAPAAIYSVNWTTGFAAGGLVPDGNITGWTDIRTFTLPAGEPIVDVNVEVSLTGSWNGDLYAYVSHTNAPQAAVLLNRPGRTAVDPFGYGDDHLTITLDDTAALGDIHSYQSAPGFATAISNNSAWMPDGRAVSPLLVDGTEARTATLSLLNGIDGSSGQWTLFVADLSSGTQPTVTRWALTVTTIPEPASAALSLLLAGLALATSRRR